ncbi:MAG: UDP-3-O-[3-hydroxymyristoyl] N-acetylglucosamine deacetylase [Vicinamibacteria bacterium]|nr:UDP-3-O-[3-hydroxymyristoyl] N-acetylglucosamine deacetylase [Vicinamibacteria bacterium]
MRQRTLQRTVETQGVGLHCGRLISIRLVPAPANTGVVFVRTDLGGREVPARAEWVTQQELAMSLRCDGAQVLTVEHLMAAFYATGVDNVRVELDGPEIPVFDGSSRMFLHLIDEAGIKNLAAFQSTLVVRRPVRVASSMGDRYVLVEPADTFEVDYSIDFDHALVGKQRVTLEVTEESFRNELSSARTFCFLKDVEAMRSRGLALGGSLDSAVVIGEDGFLSNPRMKDEFVRHKALDAIGDLALIGFRLRGRVVAACAGHALHAELVRALLKDHAAWSIETGAPHTSGFGYAGASA